MTKNSFIFSGLIFFGGILLGFSIPQFLSKSPVQIEKLDCQESLREKLQSLTDVEIAEYLKLRDLKERYEKADEILGKILALFISDVGIRVSRESLDQLKSNSGLPIAVAELPKESHAGNGSNLKTSSSVPANQPKWTTAENTKDDVRNENQLEDFLSKVKLDDPDIELKKTTRFLNQSGNLENLNGLYVGQGRATVDGADQVWDIELRFQVEFVENSLKGISTLQMFKNGKMFSNSSDRGDIKSVREFSSGSQGLVIKASPTTTFQLYYFKNLHVLAGNIYHQQEEEGKPVYSGTLRLKKTD